MSPTLITLLTLISGISWSIVYIDLINRGFKDKTYGMPLFALGLNIAWEFTFAFVTGWHVSVQKVVNVIWFGLDLAIVYTYFKYGRRDFPKAFEKFFIPWSMAAFVLGFVVIYTMVIEFGEDWGARYSAFGQNLLMSILFISMLARRNSVEGQSMYIALFKWIGTFAPTIQYYARTGSGVLYAIILLVRKGENHGNFSHHSYVVQGAGCNSRVHSKAIKHQGRSAISCRG